MYAESNRHGFPLALHLVQGWLPLHLVFLDLQKSHARLTFGFPRLAVRGVSAAFEDEAEGSEGNRLRFLGVATSIDLENTMTRGPRFLPGDGESVVSMLFGECWDDLTIGGDVLPQTG